MHRRCEYVCTCVHTYAARYTCRARLICARDCIPHEPVFHIAVLSQVIVIMLRFYTAFWIYICIDYRFIVAENVGTFNLRDENNRFILPCVHHIKADFVYWQSIWLNTRSAFGARGQTGSNTARTCWRTDAKQYKCQFQFDALGVQTTHTTMNHIYFMNMHMFLSALHCHCLERYKKWVFSLFFEIMTN